MDASKHTPGPWEWDCGALPPDGPGRYADIYVDGGDKIIASFNEFREFSPEEGRANARLIAAAPELLEALKAAQAALDSIAEQPSLDADDAAHWRANAACDALHAIGPALAKATGEQA